MHSSHHSFVQIANGGVILVVQNAFQLNKLESQYQILCVLFVCAWLGYEKCSFEVPAPQSAFDTLLG